MQRTVHVYLIYDRRREIHEQMQALSLRGREASEMMQQKYLVLCDAQRQACQELCTALTQSYRRTA
jgi:hypothetical protein